MAALTVSLIIASVDRFFPLYRSLKHQRVHKHINFMKKQRLVSETQLDIAPNKEKWLSSLKGKKYKR